MINKKLGKGTDFDLALFNAQDNQEYQDDTTVIQRNSSVLVSRKPALKPGKGTAQKYLSQAPVVVLPSSTPKYPMAAPKIRPPAPYLKLI